MRRHLEHLRNKPEHVRKTIALGAAGALTVLVTLGWGVASITSGSLALAPTSLSGINTAPLATAASQTSSSFSQLLGAVGAASSASSSPSLQIVDGGHTSTIATTSTQATVIPF